MHEVKLSSYFRLALLLVALPFIIASQCTVLFSSGDSNDDDKDKEEEVVVIASTGSFVDSPVEGISYRSGPHTGITGPNGEFQYQEGQSVQFAIGDITLGEPVTGKAFITPVDLVPGSNIDTPAVLNIARLLLSLDTDPDDDVITIGAAVRNKAVLSNSLVSTAIEFLDFHDDDAFANAASQLVAVLTADYPFTASLVDAETAGQHLRESLQASQ